jgi:hypothetical protein
MESFETWCWRRMELSWADRVRNGAILRTVKVERKILHTMKRGKLIGLVTSCVGTAFGNTLLKERQKGREEEEEDVSSYCTT